MKKLLIALLAAIGAVAAAAYFWQKYQGSAKPAWSEASESLSHWGRTAADKVGETTDKIADQASRAAGEVRSTGQ